MYHIVLRPLQNADEPFTEFKTSSDGEIKHRDTNGDMSWYTWSPDDKNTNDKQNLTGAVWQKTSPTSADNTTSTTIGTSTSYSGNIGFFGGTGTGG